MNSHDANPRSQFDGSTDVPDAASVMTTDLQEPNGVALRSVTTFGNATEGAVKSEIRRSVKRRHSIS